MRRVLGIFMAGLVGVACAGSAAGPTQAQYVGVGNQVCDQARERIGAARTEQMASAPDERSMQRFVRFEVIAGLKNMLGSLSTIPAPEGDGGYLMSMYQDYNHALGLWYSSPLGDTHVRALAAAEARLANYGMDNCVGVATGEAPAATGAPAPAAPAAATGAAPASD